MDSNLFISSIQPTISADEYELVRSPVLEGSRIPAASVDELRDLERVAVTKPPAVAVTDVVIPAPAATLLSSMEALILLRILSQAPPPEPECGEVEGQDPASEPSVPADPIEMPLTPGFGLSWTVVDALVARNIEQTPPPVDRFAKFVTTMGRVFVSTYFQFVNFGIDLTRRTCRIFRPDPRREVDRDLELRELQRAQIEAARTQKNQLNDRLVNGKGQTAADPITQGATIDEQKA